MKKQWIIAAASIMLAAGCSSSSEKEKSAAAAAPVEATEQASSDSANQTPAVSDSASAGNAKAAAEAPTDTESVSEPDAEASSNSTVQPKTEQIHALGETVETDAGLDITLNKVYRLKKGASVQLFPDQPIMMLDVTVVNQSSHQVHLALADWSVSDGEGFNADAMLTFEQKGDYSGDVEPGGTLRAEVAFRTSEAAPYKIKYHSFLLQNNTDPSYWSVKTLE